MHFFPVRFNVGSVLMPENAYGVVDLWFYCVKKSFNISEFLLIYIFKWISYMTLIILWRGCGTLMVNIEIGHYYSLIGAATPVFAM